SLQRKASRIAFPLKREEREVSGLALTEREASDSKIIPAPPPALQCSFLLFSSRSHQYFQSIRAGKGHFIEL
ncbi:hypothetical protein, partial [Pseudomonas syringae]|uniref:hypothetical protein n=1 Tax=Pseudomonas syringae TaxID=317 RepID=UPI001F23A729